MGTPQEQTQRTGAVPVLCFRCGVKVKAPEGFEGRVLCRGCAAKRAEPAPIQIVSPGEDDRGRAPCLKCGAVQRAGVSVCPSCGHDPAAVPLETTKAREVLGEFDADPDTTPLSERLRERARSRKRKERETKEAQQRAAFTCSGCSYPLGGLKPTAEGIQCPECGKVSKPFLRSDWDAETSESVAKRSVRRPLLWMGVGIPLVAVLAGAHGWIVGGVKGSLYGFIGPGPKGGMSEAIVNAGAGLLVLAGAWVVGVVVTAVCGLIWTGLNTTIRLMLLQIAGIMSVAAVVLLLGLSIPAPIPTWVVGAIAGGVYAYLLADAQDLYGQDAVFVTGATGLGLVVVRFALGLL